MEKLSISNTKNPKTYMKYLYEISKQKILILAIVENFTRARSKLAIGIKGGHWFVGTTVETTNELLVVVTPDGMLHVNPVHDWEQPLI